MSYEIRPYRGKKEGVYEIDIKVRLPDGTEIRERKKSPCKGKEDSKRWAAQREHELQQLARSGELKKALEIPTVEAFWLRYLAAKRLRPSSMRVKGSQYRTWILPFFGAVRLDRIGGEQVAKFSAHLQASLCPGSVRSVLIVLGDMLATAKEWKLLKDIPRITSPKLGEQKRNAVAPENFERVLQAAEDESVEAAALVLLAGEMAMRVGEIIGLWWSSIDFNTGIITVERNLYEGALGPPKSGKSRRFKATPRVLAALRELPRKRADFILVAEGGGPWSTCTVNRVLAKVFARAGLPKMGPHSLRHCATTRLALANTPAHVIRQITGHSNLVILQRYLHDNVDDTAIAVQCLANLDPTSRPELGEIQEKRKDGPVASLAQMRRRRS